MAHEENRESQRMAHEAKGESDRMAYEATRKAKNVVFKKIEDAKIQGERATEKLELKLSVIYVKRSQV